MSTLYIRDVSDDVAAILKSRATDAGMSLSAYVARQLTQLAQSPSNSEIIERLRGRDRTEGATTADILTALHESRL